MFWWFLDILWAVLLVYLGAKFCISFPLLLGIFVDCFGKGRMCIGKLLMWLVFNLYNVLVGQ